MGFAVMTGRELYELLQARAYGFLWAGWDLLDPKVRRPFEEVAGILNERQAERVAAEVAGEDI